MLLRVVVKPSKDKTELVSYDKEKHICTVHLKARPEKNRANKELIQFLKKHFKKEVSIVKGLASREKRVELK